MPTTVETHDSASAGNAEHSSVRSPGAHAVLWIAAAVALIADLWSKHWAFTALAPDDVRFGPWRLLAFQRSLNDGALFGMGKGLVPLFIIASALAVAFILYLFAHSDRRQHLLHAALGLILAGAIGNMYDRTFMRADRLIFQDDAGKPHRVLGVVVSDAADDTITVGSWPDGVHPRSYERERLLEPPRRLGVVRDFIKIQPIGGRDVWPWVFNIADALLVVGVAMLLITFAFSRRRPAGAGLHGARGGFGASDAGADHDRPLHRE
jgi:lipoprotein signal peptidase